MFVLQCLVKVVHIFETLHTRIRIVSLGIVVFVLKFSSNLVKL